MKNFKVGDWVFCQFKLQQIKEMDGSRITAVSDGSFTMSSSDLLNECFTIDMHIKNASDHLIYWSHKFHSLNNAALNYPGLNRKLRSLWVNICQSESDSDKKMAYEALDKFTRAVYDKIESFHYEQVDGISLFRR